MYKRLPLLRWLADYHQSTLLNDLNAGVVVAILLIPQSMAYALLAGAPPAYGLYASLLPLILYALFASSRALSVGPVAITALMVHSALSNLSLTDADSYLLAATHLSVLTAIFLMGMRVLRLSKITNFISHAVISGFTSAAAVMITISQLKPLLGLDLALGNNLLLALPRLWQALPQSHMISLVAGVITLGLLWGTRHWLAAGLERFQCPAFVVKNSRKTGPLLAVVLGIMAGSTLPFEPQMLLGEIPQGLPTLALPAINLPLLETLWVPALLIALIVYIESISIATVQASQQRERINPEQELTALSLANVGAALCSTFPVAGSFGRSVVNADAGAQTPVASLIAAVILGITLLSLTPLFTTLPHSVLAAIIIMAVIPLIDLQTLRQMWRFNRGDAATLLVTFIAVLTTGVELGILIGVGLSLVIFLQRTSVPHIAVVGRIADTAHFRNVTRHPTQTCQTVLAVRVDESLYFANTRHVEQYILTQTQQTPGVRHVLLICSAVNFIDANALETLEVLSHQLRHQGITLHLSDIKGPVMDRLQRIDFSARLGDGEIFFSTDAAITQLQQR